MERDVVEEDIYKEFKRLGDLWRKRSMELKLSNKLGGRLRMIPFNIQERGMSERIMV